MEHCFSVNFPCPAPPISLSPRPGPTHQPLPPPSSCLRSRPLAGHAAAPLRGHRLGQHGHDRGLTPRLPACLPLSPIQTPPVLLPRPNPSPIASSSLRSAGRRNPPPPVRLCPIARAHSVPSTPSLDSSSHRPFSPPTGASRRRRPPTAAAPHRAAARRPTPLARAAGEHPCCAVLCCSCTRCLAPFAPRAVPPSSAAATSCRVRAGRVAGAHRPRPVASQGSRLP
jgi:hypothetical protein